MRTAIDTKSLSASWSAEPLTSEAARLLGRAHREGGLVIRGAVYCELLAYPKITGSFVVAFLPRRKSWWILIWMTPFGVRQYKLLPDMRSGAGSPGL